ncbi:uncharacterized protein LOC8072411 [Sorghum bicolor]|uniref:uncharacterized protein LOC8072411 n=1 Tax=Sorghum bicolor TaxID=4558 RepID=UPI0001A84E1F|nr:uncharacterized protein LOC8072411 [Sorghum bicolor]|eukprot:XP_002457578.1 uncharacterized protein LOC8072411 [Sorghum bicolor]
MASLCSRPQQFWFLTAVACIFCCFSLTAAAAFHGQKGDIAVADIVGRALFCFNDRYIYSGCQGSFRLGPQGALDVPPGSADAFCGGPCLAETELVLRCVDGIMSSFRFYNGASAADVRFALDRGCGYSALRGHFDVLQRVGAGADGRNYGDGYFYGRGDAAARRSVNDLVAVAPLLLLSAAAAILVWA